MPKQSPKKERPHKLMEDTTPRITFEEIQQVEPPPITDPKEKNKLTKPNDATSPTGTGQYKLNPGDQEGHVT